MARIRQTNTGWLFVDDNGKTYPIIDPSNTGSPKINWKYSEASVAPDEDEKPDEEENLFEMTGKIELDADEFEGDIDRLIAKIERLNEELSKLG